MLQLRPISKSIAITGVLFVLLFSNLPRSVFAELKPNTQGCVDLLLVFARGSGQNQQHELANDPFNPDFKTLEPESYSFFNWFKTHLDKEYPHIDYKAVSVHNFPDKYDDVGYKAVPVGTEFLAFPTANTRNAEISAFPGDYRESVEHGTNETVGYLKDQTASCPSQSIVVGGYSQGAQVMGDSLFRLTPDERTKIVGVGLFGDPKYIGAKDDSLLNPFDDSTSYPWRRGDATNKDAGMLDPRVPYVPDDLAKKTISYCYRSDLVCSGWSGFRGTQDTAHGNYGNEPMRNSVNELMLWAAPVLGQLERARGGFDTTTNDTSIKPPDNKMRDILFLLNDDSSLGDALYEFRYDTDVVMSPFSPNFPNTQYALKGFGEGDEGGVVLPRVNNIQSFLPYTGYDPNQPFTSMSNMYRAIAKTYPFGQPGAGGGDWPDPHGLAIERSLFGLPWRDDAEKHIVLITDRPPKQGYSYNICHSSVRSWLQIPNTNGYDACYINGGANDIWPKVQHPEVCETIYKAIIQDDCKNPITKPGYTQFVNRSLDDAIYLAQSYHIAVDIVVPHKVIDQYNPTAVTKMQADLEHLAKSTDGAFIYYNQRDRFDRATYIDMLYQIFGHTPKDIQLAYKEALNGQDTFNSGHVLGFKTNQPVILDASQTNTSFARYRWDYDNNGTWDETSSGPVVEHTFTSPQTGFIRLAGVNDDNTTAVETHMAVAIVPGEAMAAEDPPSRPAVSAQAQPDGSVKLTWQSTGPNTLLVVDALDHLPITTTSLANNELVLPAGNYTGTTLELRILSDVAASGSWEVTITPAPINDGPAPDTLSDITEEPPVQQTDPSPIQGGEEEEDSESEQSPVVQTLPDDTTTTVDPTLCYKLQECNGESLLVIDAPTAVNATLESKPTVVGQIASAVTQAISADHQTTPSAPTNISSPPHVLSSVNDGAVITSSKSPHHWRLFPPLVGIITLLALLKLIVSRTKKPYA